jgi:hypothetical protein
MKNFLTKTWNQPGVKLAGVFALIMAVGFSTWWSFNDRTLNLWPLLYALCFYVFLWLMSYVFRNNP